MNAAGELGVEAVQGRGDALLRPLYNGKPKDHEDSETGVDVGDAEVMLFWLVLIAGVQPQVIFEFSHQEAPLPL